MSIRTDRVRAFALFQKKADITKEQFQQYWLEHGTIFSSIDIVKSNILKYEQSHANEGAASAVSSFGLPVAPYDGVAILEAESYEKIMAVFANEEYLRVVVPDEQKFVDREKGQLLFANLASFIDN